MTPRVLQQPPRRKTGRKGRRPSARPPDPSGGLAPRPLPVPGRGGVRRWIGFAEGLDQLVGEQQRLLVQLGDARARLASTLIPSVALLDLGALVLGDVGARVDAVLAGVQNSALVEL